MSNYQLIKNPTSGQLGELESIMNPLLQPTAVETLLKVELCLESILNEELRKENDDDFDLDPDIVCRNMMLRNILSAIAKTCDLIEGNSDIAPIITGGENFTQKGSDKYE